MKKSIYFILFLSLIFTSCYVYRPYEGESKTTTAKNVKGKNVRTEDSKTKKMKSTRQLLEPKKYYKIKVAEKQYKIEVEEWQSDSLVCHIKGRPNKQLKFSEKDIKEVQLRHFSKVQSDLLTVGLYAIGIAGLIIIL